MASKQDKHANQEIIGTTGQIAYKIGTAAGLFAITLACCYLPFMFRSFKTNKTLLGLANSMAGGIFLSAGLIHIIPEATELFDEGEDSKHRRFPWISFTVICSFGLILFLDRVILPSHSGHGHGHESHSNHNHGSEETELHHYSPYIQRGQIARQEDHAHGAEHREEVAFSSPPGTTKKNQIPPGFTSLEIGTATREYEHLLSPEGNLAAQLSGKKNKNVLGPFAILIAMGLHATCEGLALGIMTNFASFIGFLIAILFHKWAESIAVGISFLKSEVSKGKRLAAFILFALLTPLGVIIGLLVTKANSKAQGIVLAVSGGTFLYISVAEIITEEFGYKDGIFWRFLAFWVGVGIMILTWVAETSEKK